MYQKSSDVLTQKNEAEIVLHNMNSDSFYSLCDVSVEIWECIERKLSRNEILRRIVNKYRIPPELAITDLDFFINELQEEKLIDVLSIED